jgi:hypothetical protein
MLASAGSPSEFTAPSPYGNAGTLDGALVWIDGLLPTGYSKYSWAVAGASAANTNGTADVALAQSADGFFLYVYFMFTNGYIVGVQFDCIDI